MVMTKFVVMNLVSFIRERLAKSHDKVLDIHNNTAFYHSFINVDGIRFIYVLYIDIIQKIRVLKRLDGAQCQLPIWYRLKEVVGQSVTVVIHPILYSRLQVICLHPVLIGYLDIIFPFIILFCITEDCNMVSERDIQKSRNGETVIACKPQLTNRISLRISFLQIGSFDYRNGFNVFPSLIKATHQLDILFREAL